MCLCYIYIYVCVIYIYIYVCVCVYIYIKADLHSGNESCTTSAVAQDHMFLLQSGS